MTTPLRSRAAPLPALLLLALALAAPSAARAQQVQSVKVGGQAPLESLTAQEREVLGWAQEFSRRCAETLERWIASKDVTVERLFASLYYPLPRTDPPKFSTDWDKLSDRDILPIEEGVLARSGAIAYAVMVDRFGYLPTHNQRYSQPLTGNAASDLVNNRTKRIFADATGLAAARSRAPFLVQPYLRDTGETMADLSVPLVVRGQHWGAVRIGYRAVADPPKAPAPPAR